MAYGATYLSGLIFSLVGLGLLDWRFRTAFTINKKAAAFAILIPTIFFILWDVAGIAMGIFFRGDTSHLTGIVLAPEFPIEELFFLLLLNYTALTLFTTVTRVIKKRLNK
ncbi:MAG: lycopene cyclase domain-containing protein [Rhodoluna sp.]|nr:lycopene cyclase domain-containing protein [Rhodoluna sp.]